MLSILYLPNAILSATSTAVDPSSLKNTRDAHPVPAKAFAHSFSHTSQRGCTNGLEELLCETRNRFVGHFWKEDVSKSPSSERQRPYQFAVQIELYRALRSLSSHIHTFSLFPMSDLRPPAAARVKERPDLAIGFQSGIVVRRDLISKRFQKEALSRIDDGDAVFRKSLVLRKGPPVMPLCDVCHRGEFPKSATRGIPQKRIQ